MLQPRRLLWASRRLLIQGGMHAWFSIAWKTSADQFEYPQISFVEVTRKGNVADFARTSNFLPSAITKVAFNNGHQYEDAAFHRCWFSYDLHTILSSVVGSFDKRIMFSNQLPLVRYCWMCDGILSLQHYWVCMVCMVESSIYSKRDCFSLVFVAVLAYS